MHYQLPINIYQKLSFQKENKSINNNIFILRYKYIILKIISEFVKTKGSSNTPNPQKPISYSFPDMSLISR